MRPTRSTRVLPGRLRPPASLLGGLGLLLLLAASAGAAEFSAPTILRPPFSEDVEGPAEFGYAVAIDRGTLAVSAPGIGGGAIYFYERQPGPPGQWVLADLLEGTFLPGGEDGFRFGETLALDGDTLVTGIPARDVAFIFRRGRRGWRLWNTLRPKLPGSSLGAAVAVSGPRIAVGAPGAGRVLIYERNSPRTNAWGRTASLQGRCTSLRLPECANDRTVVGFGTSVGLSGKTLAVGAWESRQTDLPGVRPRNHGAYLFQVYRTSRTGWRQTASLAPPVDWGPDGSSIVSLSGPDLLWSNGFVWAVHERNHPGADRWGWRNGRPLPGRLEQTDRALRGNTIAFGDRGGEAAWVYERDVPVTCCSSTARNSWGLVARLSSAEVPFTEGTAVAIGPREVVTGHPAESVVQIFPRSAILADGFESGGTGAWSGRRGRVGVVSPGLDGSDAALEVTLGEGTGASFVAANRPRREPVVSLELTLLVNNVDLARGQVELLRLFAGKPALRLRLVEDAFGTPYRLVLQARGRKDFWLTVGSIAITGNEEWRVAVEYQAPSAAGAVDGRARLAVRGLAVRQVRNLDMDRLLINRVVLGLPLGSPPAAGGSFLVDNFEMHR